MVHTLDSSFLHKQGIDTLLGALIKLKNPKISEFTPDELWTGDIVPRSVCHFCHVLSCFTLTLLACPRRFNDLKQGESDDCLLSESKVTLQSLKKAGSLLANLQKSLQQATAHLESTLLPFEFGRGLSSVPDSILSLIFESVCPRSRNRIFRHIKRPDYERLALVCRRFRDVLSSSPRVWSTIVISDATNTNEVNIFLERSKAVGLEVQVSGYVLPLQSSPNKSQHHLSTALLHSERWEALELDFDNTHAEKIEEKLKSLRDLRLPRLRNFKIKYPRHGHPQPSWHFYETCGLEMLRSFQITNLVPVPFVAPLLTALCIEFSDAELATDDLLDFLSANPALKDIHFSISGTIIDESEVIKDVVLENVESFKLTLGCVHLDSLYPFGRALRMPNVSKINLVTIDDDWDWSDDESGDDDIDPQQRDWKDTVGTNEYLEFTLCHESYPHLKEFRFEHGICGGCRYSLPFYKMPKLQFLELCTGDLAPTYDTLDDLPPLKRIDVYCSSYPEQGWEFWLEELHGQMERQNKLNNFEELYIQYKEHEKIRDVGNLFGQRVVCERIHSSARS